MPAPKPASTPTTFEYSMYGVSAGLDAVSGVLDLLASDAAAEAANTRADMIRNAALADAQRYNEQAQAHIAQMSVMYSASGVTLAGSPIDVLDKQAQIASENAASIVMKGEIEALDEQQAGQNAGARGRNALVGGLTASVGALAKTGFRPPPAPVADSGGGQ